uniref:Zmp:0000000760 n=1 Tax=Sphaeramia orbicularis TaxID=375764 RepID=A0A673B2S1_9TELE
YFSCNILLLIIIFIVCFNLLEEFRVPESRGVRQVDGSQPEAVAYRINPSIHLRKTMSDVYPDGLPADYSVIATFKVTKDTAQKSWNLWQVSDSEGRDQVGLRFQGDTRSLDFFYTSPHGSQMLRTFPGVEKLFDGEWHKLALSVKGSEVKLLIDCQEVSVESIDEPRPVIRQGYTSIVKRAAGDRSVSVDLQQMEVSCDPEQAYSEGCCELSNVCGGYAEIGLTAGGASCKCMHGQPGIQGPPGPKVSIFLFNRVLQGIRGNTGDYGNVGEPGQKGEQGIKGEKGMRGLWGQVGDRGPKGLKGLKGAAGFKVNSSAGIVGDPGERGSAGQKGQPGIIGDPGLPGRDGDPGIEAYQGPQGQTGKLGRSGVKGEKGILGPAGEMGPQGRTGPRGYKGSAGKPGRPGFIGPPGPTGHVGVPGKPGSKGDTGIQGIQGVKGAQAAKGVKGPKGRVGDRGEQGPQGGRGKRGSEGPPGRSGPVGVKGVRGEGGPDGFQGPPGPPGPTLPAQHVIEVCKKVVLEQMSTFANSVKRTCAAVCPLYGDVPMGAPGPPGQKGPSGPPGDPGNDGDEGEVGPPGFYGEAGDPGRQGDKGVEKQGLNIFASITGQRGRLGRAFNGQPGKQGERGHVGRPGLRGHPGLRGPPGVCLTSGCATLLGTTSGTSGTIRTSGTSGTSQPVPRPTPRRLRNRRP